MKFLWLAVLLVVLLGGCSEEPPFKATDVRGAGFGGDFRLVDHHGRVRTLADFRGKVVLLNFGYTHCPDICPTTLAGLAAAMERLGEQARQVQVLFVTLDPARDTPAHLAGYLPFFHPDFLGLSGDEATTAAVARNYRVLYQVQHTGSQAGYSVDHSTGIYAFDSQGRLRLFIAYRSSVDDVVHDVRLLMQ